MTGEPVGKQERTYARLRDRILTGVYAPGQKLTIKTIADEMEMSPMPVREAIRRLEAEGWVVYERYQGAMVTPVAARSGADALTTLALLEGYATALGAPHLLDEDFDRLRELNDEMRQSLAQMDPLRTFDANRRFHRTIYSRCPTSTCSRTSTPHGSAGSGPTCSRERCSATSRRAGSHPSTSTRSS